MNPAFILLYWY